MSDHKKPKPEQKLISEQLEDFSTSWDEADVNRCIGCKEKIPFGSQACPKCLGEKS